MALLPSRPWSSHYTETISQLLTSQKTMGIFPVNITSLILSRILHKTTSVVSGYTHITLYCYILQGIGTLPTICFFYGLPSFYGTVLCIACSQLELLRTRLLEINEKTETLEGESGFETEEEEGKGQAWTTQAVFSHKQKQLNDCVSHHQLILE